MQPQRIRLALCITALLTSAAPAQKTQVTVSRGQVKADAPAGTVLVQSGQKAVLLGAARPAVTVDDPMVDDLIRMSTWVEAERKAASLKIDYTSIQIHSIEDETTLRAANLMEIPNNKTDASDTCRIGLTSIADDPKYYDLDGHLLAFDLQKVDAKQGYYYIHFPQAVPAGGTFRFIEVSRYVIDSGLRQKGKLWQIRQANNTPNCLNYFQVILPKSAIFVDADLPVTMVSTVGGRVAVTIRNYTGASADGATIIAFLWPDKDGTSLADLPGEYRGLVEPLQQKFADEYRTVMAKIRAGGSYEDQSTPLRALLTWNAAIIRRDKDLLARVQFIPMDKQTFLDRVFAEDMIQGLQSQLVDTADFLSTSAWPENPADRTVHLIRMTRPGSRIRAATYAMAFLNGKWLRVCDASDTANPNDFAKLISGQPEPEAATRLKKLPWDKAGPEALEVYDYFIAQTVSDGQLWTELGIKLAGGQFWKQSLDAFTRAEHSDAKGSYLFAARVWQGHIHDVLQERDQAVASYQAALAAPQRDSMRHDQWGIVLNDEWVKQRLASPFRKEMLREQRPAGTLAELQFLPWNNAGGQALEIYKAFVEQNQPDPQFWGQLGIKLAGGGFWTESMDAFVRSEKANPEPIWLFTSRIWQGHLLDLTGQRDKAVERYKAALQVPGAGGMRMRHDQWKVVLDSKWVKQRLASPFTKEMIGK